MTRPASSWLAPSWHALSWLRGAWRPALLLAGLVGAGVALRGLGLDARVAAAGENGPLGFVALGALACAAGVPRQVAAYAGGLAFGFWPGAALALVAEMLGCAVDFYWARLGARGWAVRWLRGRGGGRLDRLDRFLCARAFTATLTLRLLPMGSNLVLNLLAGVSGVAAGPFLLASLLGYVPQTAVFALLGSGVRVSGWVTVALGAAGFALSIGLGVLLLRRRPIPAQGRASTGPTIPLPAIAGSACGPGRRPCRAARPFLASMTAAIAWPDPSPPDDRISRHAGRHLP